MLRIDTNRAYALPTAIRLAPALAELDIRNWEDPVATFEEKWPGSGGTRPFPFHPITSICRGPWPWARRTPLSRMCRCTADSGGCSVSSGACETVGLDWWPYSGDSGVGSADVPARGRGHALGPRTGPVPVSLAGGRRHRRRPFCSAPQRGARAGRPRAGRRPVSGGPGPLSPGCFWNQGPMNKFHDPPGPGRVPAVPPWLEIPRNRPAPARKRRPDREDICLRFISHT